MPASAWLREKLAVGSWLLDPFGVAPEMAVAAAQRGYRVLVVTQNPVLRFLHEIACQPAGKEEFQLVLAELSKSMRGDQRLEPYLLSLYHTQCVSCGSLVSADAFVWERGGDYPLQRIYHCPLCGENGDYPTTQEDIDRASQYTSSGLYRARALERVVPPDDPDRQVVVEAVSTYLPRALFVLLVLINKLDSLPVHHQNLMRSLLLVAFDQANTLWHSPPIRHRPRQLSTPLHFLEKNIWHSLEAAVELLAGYGESNSPAVPITLWPQLPPESGGVVIFDGKLKDLAQAQPDWQLDGLLAAIPRPNQAFWTYSALWAGWLWGSDVAAPFKIGLRRRRYDWGWHTSALGAAFANSLPLLKTDAPLFGMIGELEGSFLSATILAGASIPIELAGIAVRADQNQAQITWVSTSSPREAFQGSRTDRIATSIQEHLSARGEPAESITLQAASLQSLEKITGIKELLGEGSAQAYARYTAELETAISNDDLFVRFGGGERDVGTGLWWLAPALLEKKSDTIAIALADQVEMECVRYLLGHSDFSRYELDYFICQKFPGVLTPGLDLLAACLSSYGNPVEPGSDNWRLQPQDAPQRRRQELVEMGDLLNRLGNNLGYRTQLTMGRQVIWEEPGIEFHLIASAMISRIFERVSTQPDRCIIVLPGSRASLVLKKLRDNPLLQKKIDAGWRFLKFRHLRRVAESQLLTRNNLSEQFDLDPLKAQDPQTPMMMG
jgi:hypothetical protein